MILSDVAQTQHICLIYSLISKLSALQRALVMMRVSGRSLPVSVKVLRCFFNFELQSESKANRFHVS